MKPGPVVWLTGPPASGKTTIARHVVQSMLTDGVPTLWLDSDDLRAVMTPEPTYSPQERAVVYGTIAHLARLASEGGVAVVISATAARRAQRDDLRAQVATFVECEVRCDQATLEARDPKGLYAKAASGQITALPGVGVAYEAPVAPELVLRTDRTPPEVLADRVVQCVRGQTGPRLVRHG